MVPWIDMICGQIGANCVFGIWYQPRDVGIPCDTVTVAVPIFVLSATDVAVIVTVAGVGTLAGAV
jgi:hypothetical protein